MRIGRLTDYLVRKWSSGIICTARPFLLPHQCRRRWRRRPLKECCWCENPHRHPQREGEGGVPRQDGLCYDNTNVHVESLEGKKAPNINNSEARWPLLRYWKYTSGEWWRWIVKNSGHSQNISSSGQCSGKYGQSYQWLNTKPWNKCIKWDQISGKHHSPGRHRHFNIHHQR